MTVIKDIRIYRSTIDNIDGNPLPKDFEKSCCGYIHRILRIENYIVSSTES